MKRDNGMNQDQEPEAGFEDRISELPDALILHMLSFLPTLYAVRTSLLSRRWRHMWTLVPVLDFHSNRDIPSFRSYDKRVTFSNFVDKCLSRHYAETTISAFRLFVEDSGCNGLLDGLKHYRYVSKLDGWLRFLEKKNVKELDLHVMLGGFYYPVPHVILDLRALNILKLNGFLWVTTLVPTNLPFLKELHLNHIKMGDQVLNSLLLGCPSLEKLRIICCCGLSNPKVSSLSLQSIEFRSNFDDHYSRCHTIEVEAINLHSFVLKGEAFHYSNIKCVMNPVQCRAIRILWLAQTFLTDQWLENLIPELPLLESLNLTDCYGFQHIKIRNQHLKHCTFTLRHPVDSLDFTIDTPNLVSFGYNSCSMFKISVNAPNLLDADIAVSDHPRTPYDVEWYARLINFLSEFNVSKSVCLSFSHLKALVIPYEARKMFKSPLPDLKHLKVQTDGRPYNKVMLRKSLLWIAPSLETLP